MAASPKEQAEGNGQVERIEVPIRWENPENIQVAFAEHIVVRHTKHEFIIRFFQVMESPGTLEEQKEIIASQESIAARCVASIGISAGTMAVFLEVLQDNYQKYRSRLSDLQLESD